MFDKLLKERKLFKWELNFDLLVGISTLLLMWFLYYGEMKVYSSNILLGLLLFAILTNILLCVVFPIWWVTTYRKQPLSELGITSKLLVLSIVLSVILALWRGISFPHITQGLNWVPHLIFVTLCFWEPFFVFGWLQSRYEKCFGIVPAVVLTASSFVIYQLGSSNLSSLTNLFLVYLVLAAVIGITRNIFSLWPIYWCVGSTVNSISAGVKLQGWDMVALYAVVLIIQMIYIKQVYKKQQKLLNCR